MIFVRNRKSENWVHRAEGEPEDLVRELHQPAAGPWAPADDDVYEFIEVEVVRQVLVTARTSLEVELVTGPEVPA